MGPNALVLLRAGHVIAVVLWVSGLSTIFWMLRFHDHAPKETHEKLTLMERSIAMSTDISATLAITCGLILSLAQGRNFWVDPVEGRWLHVKAAAVLLGVLSVHGILRARIKRYARGDLKPVPMWVWSLLLAGIVIAIFAVETKLSFN
jgi:uncharacterized membrane protein